MHPIKSPWAGFEMTNLLLTVIKNRKLTYHAKIFLSIFHSTKHKRVPQWIKLVTPVIHDPGQIAVQLFWPQRVPIIPHIVIKSTNTKHQTINESEKFHIKLPAYLYESTNSSHISSSRLRKSSWKSLISPLAPSRECFPIGLIRSTLLYRIVDP